MPLFNYVMQSTLFLHYLKLSRTSLFFRLVVLLENPCNCQISCMNDITGCTSGKVLRYASVSKCYQLIRHADNQMSKCMLTTEYPNACSIESIGFQDGIFLFFLFLLVTKAEIRIACINHSSQGIHLSSASPLLKALQQKRFSDSITNQLHLHHERTCSKLKYAA